jgi:hypothetical protein
MLTILFTEEVGGEHQRAPGARDEVGQGFVGHPLVPEDPAQRQGCVDTFPFFRFCCCFLLGAHIGVSARVAKLILISNNCQPLTKSEIEYYAMLAKTGVYHYTGCTLFVLV